MKPNKLYYLGFLGLLGLLGLVSSNIGFYGFFGFFGFFSFKKIKNDERLEANINKSTRNAFVSSLIFFVLVTVYTGLTSNFSIIVFAFALNFALQIIVFTFSLKFYDDIKE